MLLFTTLLHFTNFALLRLLMQAASLFIHKHICLHHRLLSLRADQTTAPLV
jgi:hypothetical protein